MTVWQATAWFYFVTTLLLGGALFFNLAYPVCR